MPLVKTEKIRDVINSLKASDIYVAEKKTVPIIHLKGIGRYCEVCKKKLQPKIISRKVNGKSYNVNIGIPSTQLYCSNACKNKKFFRKNQNTGNNIYAKINLNVIEDKLPYRKMTIYLKKGKSFDFKITKESKELWQYLERLARYKTLNVTQEKREVILAR